MVFSCHENVKIKHVMSDVEKYRGSFAAMYGRQVGQLSQREWLCASVSCGAGKSEAGSEKLDGVVCGVRRSRTLLIM